MVQSNLKRVSPVQRDQRLRHLILKPSSSDAPHDEVFK